MKSTKKLIISFVISLIVVLIAQFVWNSFFSSNEEKVYMLVKEVYKGEKITKEDVKEINVQKDISMKNYYNVDIVDKVAKENLVLGKILQDSDLQLSNEFQYTDEKYEYISIEIKDISNALAYQLSKGENINVYFTSRDIAGNESGKSIVENTKTIKVLENKKIIGLYDSSGNEVQKGEVYNALILRVTEEEAMMVSNIKDEGNFNMSLVK